MIPGDDLQLSEAELLQNIGKYFALHEHSEKKRMVLAQAYNALKAKYDALVSGELNDGDVIQGMP